MADFKACKTCGTARCWVSVHCAGTILQQTAPMRQSCDNLQQSLRSAPLTEELKEEAKIVAAIYRVLIDAVNPCFRLSRLYLHVYLLSVASDIALYNLVNVAAG